jgi:type II secretory pathway pseudopilin PulG
MKKLLSAAIAAALAMPIWARADAAADLAAVREDMAALRATYEARLQALERRLQSAEAALAAQPRTPETTATTTAGAALPAPAPTPAPTPTPPGTAGTANAFNPALSLVLSGLYAHTSRDPSDYAIAGFALPRDAAIGPGTRGFSLAESELGLAASIDPWLRGAANISIGSDGSVDVEEAYLQTTSLGNGLSLKAGRFLSAIGYLNAQHAHTWDFVDAPLAYQAMLGSQFGDDGVQLTWLAPLDEFVELGVELGRGRSVPGSDTGRNGPGMAALTAHTGGDLGTSHSWRAGVSLLHAKARDQSLSASDADGNRVGELFDGATRVWVADAVWKWAPNGNATRVNFKLQGEYLQSTRKGDLVYDVGGADIASTVRARQSGWYLQGVYQFMPRWRLGARTERLDPGTPEYGIGSGTIPVSDARPRKDSLMLDFSPSEFSRVRLQLARDRAREGRADTQWFVQYQVSLGAHGAHSY